MTLKRKRHVIGMTKDSQTGDQDLTTDEVVFLERQISNTRLHYNNIGILLHQVTQSDRNGANEFKILISLCRIFCRLIVAGDMTPSTTDEEENRVVVRWLRKKYKDYIALLLASLSERSVKAQTLAVDLLVQLAKVEQKVNNSKNNHSFRSPTFIKLSIALLLSTSANHARDEFCANYLKIYDDIQYCFYEVIISLSKDLTKGDPAIWSSQALYSMRAMKPTAGTGEKMSALFFGSEIPAFADVQARKKLAQGAWLVLLKSTSTLEHRKILLSVMSTHIAPCFNQVELLMDFIIDSYDVGGSLSLLALSGVYYLISERNLDYPQFYTKLYSLLDTNLLHSKHRSKFFSSLEIFMSSTHLPAALVASFIKRLSRLALHAPPAGMLAVIPWIYNMLQSHPLCTFMIHREVRSTLDLIGSEEKRWRDPFIPSESNPMLTNAINSSLWELHTLSTHYHPQVATIAKIISEPFTRPSYKLEDFLNHSYDSLLDAELHRELQNAPVREEIITSNPFLDSEDKPTQLGGLLRWVEEPIKSA